MTLKNRTSSKHRKPAVYVDQSALQKESHAAYVKKVRAKKYAAIRTGAKQPIIVAPVKPVATAEEANDDDAASSNQDGSALSAAGGVVALPVGLDGFTVSLAPFTSADSSTLTTTTTSALKDDKVLGVALWEWLLGKLEWDCHTLWECFLREWDLITETERPPGTNRPINLHSYLTYLRSTNNKHLARKDIRDVRDLLRVERETHLRDHGHEDHLAEANLKALNGTLLQYYLKIKNLIPYESDAKRKKNQLAADRKRKAAAASSDEAAADASDARDYEIVEAAVQTKKKARQQAPPTAPRPTSTLKGQASCFAALLDCD